MILLPHTSQHENIYLKGMTKRDTPRTTIAGKTGFWGRQLNEQLRGGPGELYLQELIDTAYAAHNGRPIGVVTTRLLDERGRVEELFIGANLITDLGALAMLRVFSNTAPTLCGFINVERALAAAQATATVSAGAQTTIAVAATSGGTAAGGNPGANNGGVANNFQAGASNNGTAQNNNNPGAVTATVGYDTAFGTGIGWSFGLATEEGVAGSVTANNSTTINITSYTVTKTHNPNDWVMAHGSTGDNVASAPTGSNFSTQQNPSPTGTGIGLRQIVLTFTYAAGVLTNSNPYTGVWLTTSSTWGAGITYARAPITPQFVGASNSLQVTWTIKV